MLSARKTDVPVTCSRTYITCKQKINHDMINNDSKYGKRWMNKFQLHKCRTVLLSFNLCCTSPKNLHRVHHGCAGTLTFNEGYICGRSSWGVHSPIFCCEGNIHGHTLWVCIHPYSVVKATSVAVYCGCALTHTLMKAVVYSLPCAAKASMMSVCNRVSVCVMFV